MFTPVRLAAAVVFGIAAAAGLGMGAVWIIAAAALAAGIALIAAKRADGVLMLLAAAFAE